MSWSFSCDPSVGSQLDLPQVDLTSFLASGVSFLGQAGDEAAKGLRPAPIKSDKGLFCKSSSLLKTADYSSFH